MLRLPSAALANEALVAPMASENPSFLYPTPTASRTIPLGRVMIPPLAFASMPRTVPENCSSNLGVAEGVVKKTEFSSVASSAALANRAAFQSRHRLIFKPPVTAYLRNVDGDSAEAGK